MVQVVEKGRERRVNGGGKARGREKAGKIEVGPRDDQSSRSRKKRDQEQKGNCRWSEKEAGGEISARSSFNLFVDIMPERTGSLNLRMEDRP